MSVTILRPVEIVNKTFGTILVVRIHANNVYVDEKMQQNVQI